MGEFEEFAEALLDQLSVEINEEKVIAELSSKIKEDSSFDVKFFLIRGNFSRNFSTNGRKIK